MKKLTAEWVRKADADLRAAKKLLAAKPPISDAASFHCQQLVEKYFKALLQEAGLPIPKIHNLAKLLRHLPDPSSLKIYQKSLKKLSPYAVDYRYPGIYASVREARSALRWAEEIRLQVRALLHIRSRKPSSGAKSRNKKVP